MNHSKQEKTWSGRFGRQYTDRNPGNPQQTDALYEKNFGISRSLLNEEFLGDLPRHLKVLEVGANIGSQLQLLQNMNFHELYGIEIQEYALHRARQQLQNVQLLRGNALAIPFRDRFFDVVYTSGVLIHISPENLPQALQEIHRCSNQYIWGYEYFSEDHRAVPYRGEKDLLWKANFAQIYLDMFADLELVKEKKIPYLENKNIDTMFLLKKRG